MNPNEQQFDPDAAGAPCAAAEGLAAISLPHMVLRRGDEFLADDFTTWTTDLSKAHRFINGAAANACWEEFRRTGAVFEALERMEKK